MINFNFDETIVEQYFENESYILAKKLYEKLDLPIYKVLFTDPLSTDETLHFLVRDMDSGYYIDINGIIPEEQLKILWYGRDFILDVVNQFDLSELTDEDDESDEIDEEHKNRKNKKNVLNVIIKKYKLFKIITKRNKNIFPVRFDIFTLGDTTLNYMLELFDVKITKDKLKNLDMLDKKLWINQLKNNASINIRKLSNITFDSFVNANYYKDTVELGIINTNLDNNINIDLMKCYLPYYIWYFTSSQEQYDEDHGTNLLRFPNDSFGCCWELAHTMTELCNVKMKEDNIREVDFTKKSVKSVNLMKDKFLHYVEKNTHKELDYLIYFDYLECRGTNETHIFVYVHVNNQGYLFGSYTGMNRVSITEITVEDLLDKIFELCSDSDIDSSYEKYKKLFGYSPSKSPTNAEEYNSSFKYSVYTFKFFNRNFIDFTERIINYYDEVGRELSSDCEKQLLQILYNILRDITISN